MKEFKGTPGRWYVGMNGEILSDAGYIVMVTDLIHGNEHDLDLASSAPKLLSALQEVIKSLEITLRVGCERIIDLGGECDRPEVMIKGHSEIARAKAAIAKALGESQ